jgi:Arc/MetJ-type ribon-helix-helix transcriptional regulator
MVIDAQNTTIEAVLPARLVAQIELLVNEGWFQDKDDLIADAVRRFLETHTPELMERYIWQDVEWGLHGKD